MLQANLTVVGKIHPPQGTWKSTQYSLLSSVERELFPLTIRFRPEMTNLIEMQEQFRQEPRLSKRWDTTRYAVHTGN